MIIKFQAFNWENSSKVFTTEDFLRSISNGDDLKNAKKIYLAHDDGFFAGIVLTIKNHKKFAVIRDKGETIDLKIHEIGTDEQLVDFNYFIFNTKKNIGMYQYHYSSCSLITFNMLIYGLYAHKLNKIKDIEIEKYTSKDSGILKNIKYKYKNSFKPSIIENQDTFEKKMQELANILYFDCSFTDLSYIGGKFTPIKKDVKNFACRSSFRREDSNSSKLKNLLTVYKSIKPSRAKVTGLDVHDNEVTYKLFSDFKNYGEYDYDNMISDMSLNQSDVKKSILENKIINELKNVFNKNF